MGSALCTQKLWSQTRMGRHGEEPIDAIHGNSAASEPREFTLGSPELESEWVPHKSMNSAAFFNPTVECEWVTHCGPHANIPGPLTFNSTVRAGPALQRSPELQGERELFLGALKGCSGHLSCRVSGSGLSGRSTEKTSDLRRALTAS